MKLHKYLLLIITFGTLTACSNDDEIQPIIDNTPPPSSTEMSGRYILTSFTVPEQVDLNQDGVASYNLMDESECYLETEIMLNEDMTFTAFDGSVLFASESGCVTEERTGHWQVSGDTLTLSAQMMDGLVLDIEYTFDGNEIYKSSPEATYPNYDDMGNQIYATGNVNLTYVKVEEED